LVESAALYEFIKNVGVPGGIALFVLWRLNGTLGALKQAVIALTLELTRHSTVESTQTTAIREALYRIEHNQGGKIEP